MKDGGILIKNLRQKGEKDGSVAGFHGAGEQVRTKLLPEVQGDRASFEYEYLS